MPEITKKITIQDIEKVYGHPIPEEHPDYFITSRLNDGFAFVAKENGKVLGFLIYTIWWGNCPFIELIKVRAENQRVGIGKALLKTAAKDIYNKNFKTLISSTEVVNNIGREFHNTCKFKKLNSLMLPHGEEQFYKIELEDLLNA